MIKTILNRRAAVAFASLVTVVAATTVIDAQPAAAVELPVNIIGFQDGVYVPVDNVVLGDAGDATVVANGNLAVTWAGSSLVPTFDEDEELESFDSDLGLRGALTLELAAETSGDVGGDLQVLTVPLTEFQAGPVTVIPYLGIDVLFSGHAEAGAQLSLVAPFDVSAAISKLGDRPTASADQPSFRPEIGLPDLATALAFDAQVELNISVTFMMLLNGLPIGGPALIAALGADLEVDLARTPWWTLDGTAGLKYAWATPDGTGLPQLPRRPPSLFPAAHLHIDHARDDGPNAGVSTRWSRAFDVVDSAVAGALAPIGERLVVVEDSSNPWMATLDGDGDPIWQQTDTQSSGLQAAARSGSGVLVAGVRGNGGLRTTSVGAETGATSWSKDVVVDGATSATWSTITPTTGGAIIAGEVRRGVTAVERPTLVEFDGAGDPTATEIDPGPGAGDALIVDMVVTPDGGLLAVGNVVYSIPDRSIDQGNVLIIRLAPDGSASSRVLGGPFSDKATGIALQSDGSYAISGQTVDTPGRSDAWVASFDADDDLLWSSIYADHPSPSLGSARATDITTVPGGDYVISGTTGTSDAADAWMIRIDNTGMPLWSKSYVGADLDELTDVVSVGSGVAAVGHTRTTNAADNSSQDLWLVRANRDGMVHFDPASGFDTVNDAVQWRYTTTHTVVALDPTLTTPPVTITDAPIATTPANATNLLLT